MTLGMVGGLGPESTIAYYRRILEAWARDHPRTAPAIVIDSLDVWRALDLVARDRPALIGYLLASLRRLAGAGVDFAVLTANTPHIVFDELAARSPVPLLSMVEVCAQKAHGRGLTRLALLGTRFTMEGSFYDAVCARHGIVVVPPAPADRSWIHERYVEELLLGEFRDDTRQRFVALVHRLLDEAGVELPAARHHHRHWRAAPARPERPRPTLVAELERATADLEALVQARGGPWVPPLPDPSPYRLGNTLRRHPGSTMLTPPMAGVALALTIQPGRPHYGWRARRVHPLGEQTRGHPGP